MEKAVRHELAHAVALRMRQRADSVLLRRRHRFTSAPRAMKAVSAADSVPPAPMNGPARCCQASWLMTPSAPNRVLASVAVALAAGRGAGHQHEFAAQGQQVLDVRSRVRRPASRQVSASRPSSTCDSISSVACGTSSWRMAVSRSSASSSAGPAGAN
jgi:hypothetical protein